MCHLVTARGSCVVSQGTMFTPDDVKYCKPQLSFRVQGKDCDISAWNRKTERF